MYYFHKIKFNDVKSLRKQMILWQSGHGRSVKNYKYVWRHLLITLKCVTQCISHVPVGLDVMRRERDLADVAELRAVDVGQGVADVAADGGKFFFS